jgi:threonine aldolase
MQAGPDTDTRGHSDRAATTGQRQNAGICPEALASFARANFGHAIAYGQDAWTAQAIAAIRELFETDCTVHFVFNGTAAI